MISPIVFLKENRSLIWLTAGWLIFAFLITSNLPLHYDEAYYWVLSNNADLGFYDHPPLTAYFLRLSTAIFGHNEFAVRLPSVLLQTASIYLVFIYLLGLTDNRRVAFWWTVVYAFVPLAVIWGGLGMNSDAGVITFEILSILALKKALAEKKIINWVYFGIGFGLGTLTKFTFPVILPGLFLYLALDRERRRYLWRKEIYISIITAIILFTPFLIWNYQHDFVTFRFNFSLRQVPWAFEMKWLQITLMTMFLFIGPIPIVLSTAYVLRSLKKLKGATKWLDPAFFIQLTLIPFFLYIGSGSMMRWHFMITLTLPVVVNTMMFFYSRYENGRFITTSNMKIVRGTAAACIIIPAIAMMVLIGTAIQMFRHPQMLFRNQTPIENSDPSPSLNRDGTTLFGTRQVGEYLRSLMEELELKGHDDLFFVSGDYREASQLSFYTPSHPEFHLIGDKDKYGRNYVFWRQKAEPDLLGRDALLVTQYYSSVEDIKKFFSEVERHSVFFVKDREGNKLRLFYFYLCADYQGDTTGILDIDFNFKR